MLHNHLMGIKLMRRLPWPLALPVRWFFSVLQIDLQPLGMLSFIASPISLSVYGTINLAPHHALPLVFLYAAALRNALAEGGRLVTLSPSI